MKPTLLVSMARFFQRNAYRREIALVIFLKLIALLFLWQFFLPTHHAPAKIMINNHFFGD